MQDINNGYIIIFEPDGLSWRNGPGGIWVAKRIRNKENTLQYYHGPNFPSVGQPARLSVTAIGPVIVISLNGREVLKATDSTYVSGRVGLRIHGDMNLPCDSTFSDVTVFAK